MTSATQKTPVSLLHTKRYALFWFSSLLSNIGTWMQQVAQPWVILSISHSSFLVGLDSFVMNAPSWLFTLWGGVIADRMDRKKVILFFQFIQFISVLVLLLLLVLGHLQVWMIIIISFLIGSTDSLSMPSFQSIIPSLVPKKEISRAVALNSTQFNLSRMVGPAIAGILMAKLGAVACFGANAFSYIPFFVSVLLLAPKGLRAEHASAPSLGLFNSISDFKIILKTANIRWPLATTFVTGLFCAPLAIFSPVLIREVFHAEVGAFGGTLAAFGLGGVLGAGIVLSPLSAKIKRRGIANFVGIFLGLILVVIAVNRSLPILWALMVTAGMAITVINISVNSFIQENADDKIRGKIASVWQLSLQGGISAGGLI
ncbi:MAG: MFS transporter, partial [Bdellovibrionota bacterium]